MIETNNTAIGPYAMELVTVGHHCICVGPHTDTNDHNYCIVVGDNLKAQFDYHLLIEGQKDRKMSEAEFWLLFPIITASLRKTIGVMKTPQTPLIETDGDGNAAKT
jgi:hypothetical protein|tara:strand:+ start:171 stop:488 length:318 start_codon:yes stop_codon:yes gene_type:complete